MFTSISLILIMKESKLCYKLFVVVSDFPDAKEEWDQHMPHIDSALEKNGRLSIGLRMDWFRWLSVSYTFLWLQLLWLHWLLLTSGEKTWKTISESLRFMDTSRSSLDYRPSNTSMMVIVMAFSLFGSECAYGGIFIASLLVFNDYAEQWVNQNLQSLKTNFRSYLEDMEVLALTFSMVNSATHCLICFLMSSQYRDTVKRLLHIGVKEKEVKVKVIIPGAWFRNKTCLF